MYVGWLEIQNSKYFLQVFHCKCLVLIGNFWTYFGVEDSSEKIAPKIVVCSYLQLTWYLF